jgi:CBS domain-containing membrane protein
MGVQRRAPWAAGFVPHYVRPRRRDVVRGGIGAFIGILIAALVGKAMPGGPAALPFIVAPIGASAVLVFAVPASPLAQPYSVLGGNMVSAFIGIAAAKLIDDPMYAAAVAVGVAIAAMMLLGCLHPPGGACALFAAVGAPAVAQHGFLFPVWPVGINTAALLAVGIAVNNLTGRRYPHVPPPEPPAGVDRPPLDRVGVSRRDVEAAIARRDEGLDIMPADVVRLIRDAEANAIGRRLGDLRCGDVMARDVVTLDPADSLFRARTLINRHRVKGLPVVDAERHLLGIVTMADLFNLDAAELATAATVMSTDVATVREDTPVADLVAIMTEQGFRHVPVLTADDRLAGLVTRSELIAVLHRALLEAN